MEKQPAIVPKAKQVGDVQDRWSWVEPSVWTEPMLAALSNGVKGGVWYSLIDKVYSRANLTAAAIKVTANKGAAGVDHVRVEDFLRSGYSNVTKLMEQLSAGSYQPQKILRVYIPKPGSTEKRPLGIPTVRDRVVQKAVVNVLEPIFEKDFAETSYGFRPGRGCQDALDKVEEYLKEGYHYIVDADLKGYFDSIPHDQLLRRIREKVADSRILSLIESFLKAGILDEEVEITPESGAPQGAVLSPLLSNIYLDPLDKQMACEGYKMVRYADDFVIMCRSEAEAHSALDRVKEWVACNGLTLHPTKTRIVDAKTEHFDFLGYRFDRHMRLVRPKSMEKLKETIRAKTKRTSGRSLSSIIASLNRALKSWHNYFFRCYHTVFSGLDSWIRRRLRSLLRKRRKLKGISRHGGDEARWPNSYFRDLGLFSLKTAWEKLANPL